MEGTGGWVGGWVRLFTYLEEAVHPSQHLSLGQLVVVGQTHFIGNLFLLFLGEGGWVGG